MRIGIVTLRAALVVPFQTLAAQTAAAPTDAQAAITEATTSIAGHMALCLTRMTTQAGHPNSEFVVLVPVGQADDLKVRGFALAPCGSKAGTFAAYKASMCKMALGNDAVQARLEHVAGANARLLCTGAKALTPQSGANTAH